LVTRLIFRRSIVDSQPGIGGRNKIWDGFEWFIRAFHFSLYFYSFSSIVFSLSFFHSSTLHSRVLSLKHAPPRVIIPFVVFVQLFRNNKFSKLKFDLCATTTILRLSTNFCFYSAYMRTYARAWKCGLYRLHAPLFTGLTTYLRGLGPFDSISIFGSTLFVTLDIYLACLSHVVSVRRNLSDTFIASSSYVPPFVFFLSCYFLISRVVSPASRTLTSRQSKRIIKSARYSVKPFIVFHVAGFIVLAGVSFKSPTCRQRTSLGRISWRTRSCTRILNVSTIHVPELTRLSDNRSAMRSSLTIKVRRLK